MTLEFVYLSDEPGEAENAFVTQANEIIKAVPSTTPWIFRIYECLSNKELYQALKIAKDLIAYEQTLISRAPTPPSETASA